MQNLDTFSLTLGITKICALYMKSPSNRASLLVLQDLSWHLQKNFMNQLALFLILLLTWRKFVLIDLKTYLYSALLEKIFFSEILQGLSFKGDFLFLFLFFFLRGIFKQTVFLLRYWFVLKWTFALNWEKGYYLGGDLSAGELIRPI